MAQKDKVKELVGRGLDSYHTRTLQQIDRINKKNKEQNHKISILSNELDNDYLTKTEEGSVVSLEHSKEGMVYLDELQGNTLVNYCTDGSKEMTLNGDIDVEGVSVTTTEGVDNGKVDIMCEGNTLVNLSGDFEESLNYNIEGNYVTFERVDTTNVWVNHSLIQPLKNGNLYTIIVDIKENTFTTTNTNETIMLTNSFTTGSTVRIPYNSKGLIKETFIANQESASGWNHQRIETVFYNATYTGKIVFGEFMILEGDWTNKEIPNYFKGMKSVGQDDTNGHKIEILSRNRNLFDGEWELGSINSSTGQLTNTTLEVRSVNFMKVKQGQILTFSYPSEKNIAIRMYDKDKKYLGATELFKPNGSVYSNDTRTVPNNVHYMKFKINETDLNFQLQVEEGSTVTEYKQQQLNKKEILLNEPLRGLPSGVKDKKVKIGNKWYIERKCKQETFDGSSDENWYVQNSNLENYSIFKLYVKNTPYASSGGRINQITDIINSEVPTWSNLLNIEKECTHLYGDKLLYVKISNSKLVTQDVDGFIKWLKNNNINIVYELATPIYEPLEVEPILNTYNDITHISNNSIIPCNMKIQNSGYNAIIKPSTLYTVALDTNKSGTIGMNLGGVKGTTTNNVLKLTTPATLTDDSLRLYGKGIKGSKVRLLEGDKTNWIPSHFEGMKSSFEDKFDATDNTYKMEILSNNKNLFDINKVHSDFTVRDNTLSMTTRAYNTSIFNNTVGQNTIQDVSKLLKLKKGTYTIGCTTNNNLVVCSINSDGSFKNALATMSSDLNKRTFTLTNNSYIDIKLSNPNLDYIVSNLQIEEGNTLPNYNYVEHKSNKIQFSSIEPLRSLPSGVKDKFIFKDGKLMIERNTSKTKITSDMNFTRSYEGWVNIVFACEVDGLIPIDISTKNVYCNVLPSFSIADLCNTLGKTGIASHNWANNRFLQIAIKGIDTVDKLREWISERDVEIVYQIESYYEEIPFELQKIILEGYENGTLFFDTNIPPTSTVTYAGETPIVKSAKSNRVEVASNTTDINDNIIPYLCDMDYRIVTLELQQQLPIQTDMFKLFGGVYEMLKRDILSKRLSKSEYQYRLTDYFTVGKLTEQQVRELEDLINE